MAWLTKLRAVHLQRQLPVVGNESSPQRCKLIQLATSELTSKAILPEEAKDMTRRGCNCEQRFLHGGVRIEMLRASVCARFVFHMLMRLIPVLTSIKESS